MLGRRVNRGILRRASLPWDTVYMGREVVAESAEGIASIRVLENGNTLVSEKTCDQVYGNEVTECVKDTDEWVTETDLHPPGHLDLEVIATDTDGESTSERFWVDIPQPPPPPALGTPVPPKFNEILQFREEYGLEKVFPVATETELNERIFNLIKAWYEPGTPAGQVARASWERWGIPMRPVDVAELEYRDRYLDNDAEQIEAWAEAAYPGSFAGYYLDHRAGGILHIGFSQNQAASLSDLKSQLDLEAEDRLETYPVMPTTPLGTLTAGYETLEADLEGNETLKSIVTELGIDEEGNSLRVGTTDILQTKSLVNELIGKQVPVNVYFRESLVPVTGRHRTHGRMRAGDRILNAVASCTAGFGAFERRTQKSNNGDITARFVLSADHCFNLDASVYRSDRADSEEPENWAPVGQVTRKATRTKPESDGLAIRAKAPDLVPHAIFGSDGSPIPTGTAGKAKVGNYLCYSGAELDGVSCGDVRYKVIGKTGAKRYGVYIVKFRKQVDHGDSGSPVWNPRTGASIGVVSALIPGTPLSAVAPLLQPNGVKASLIPGILHDPDMFNLHLIAGS